MTEDVSTVTGCEYTTDGATWLSGTLSGSGPWTCSASPSGLTGSLTINIRATSTGGVGTGLSPVSLTVDSTPPTDGATLTVTPGDQQNTLDWSAATDAGSGVSQYDVRYLTGSTPPATCADGTSIYTGSNPTFTQGGLTNGQAYSYRVCASDTLGNTSTGLTGTATPVTVFPNTVAAVSTAVATTATESTTGVVMQRLAVDSNTVSGSDNKVVLSSLTLDDAGNTTQIATAKIYVADTASATLPDTATLIGGKTTWNGTSTTIFLTGGTAAKRTVTAGTTKYLYVVYDMAFGQSGKTVQSHVTSVGVSAPDNSATVSLSSNLFTLTAGSSAAVATSCGSCHGYPPVDSTGATPQRNVPAGSVVGSHGKHGANACATCHISPATETSADFKHRNGNIQFIGGLGYSKGTSFAQTNDLTGAGLGTCSTASCHDAYGSTGVATPKWGTAATCSSCHAAGADGSPGTGSHPKHMALAASACNQCHAGATKDVSGGSAHVDGTVDVINGYPANVTKHTAVSYSGTCSTASCHSDVYSSGTVTTPIWGTAAGCSACHTTAIDTTGPATGSHVAHNTTDCSQCHTGATNNTTIPTMNHADGNIDVADGYPADVTKHAAGTYIGTCSTASCHANVYGTGTVTTPVWGTASGCEACHTTAIDITGPATGSHVSHNDANCVDCHTGANDNVTIPTANHADGNIDVADGYPANVTKHAAGTYTGTCSTASCHANVYGTGTVTTPVWGTAAGCTACHSTAIGTTGPATGSHVAHNDANCVDCHTGATNNTTVPTANHADGDIDVSDGYPANVTKHTAGTYTGTCSTASCHANVYGTGTVTTPVWGTAAGCTACHTTAIGTTGPATGSHVAHNDANCVDCHTGATNNTTVPTANHADGNIDVADGYPANVTKHTAGTYTGTCSTASCHANVYGTGTVTTPVWGTTAGCTACHTTAIDTTGPATGSHVAHNDANCVDCHTGATNNTTVPTVNHADGNIDVADGYPANVTKHAAGTYTGTCSTASCHANVYGTGTVTTPVWGTAAGCTACHSTAIDTTGPATGSHVAHNTIDCSQCHTGATNNTTVPTANHADGNIDVADGYPANVTKHTAGTYTGTCSTASCHANVYGTGTVTTPVWGTAAGCTACHSVALDLTGPATGSHVAHNDTNCVDCHTGATNNTTVPTANHADGNIDVADGYPANVTKHAAGTYTGTCSTASCHANVYGTGTVTTPVWGTASGCEACHTTAIGTTGPATGSHAAHNDTNCVDCHAGATDNVTIPTANHADGNIDVADGYPANVTKHTAGTYTGTCSTASCHSNPYGTGTVTTPVWGTVAGCGACHTGSGAFTGTGSGPATGSHNTHMALAGAACNQCHAGAVANTSGGSFHTDGNIDTAAGAYPTNIIKHAAGSGYATAACSTNTCHGTGTKTWGANTSNASCTKCHGKGTVLANYSTTNAWQAAPGYATTGVDVAGNTGTFTNGVSNDAQVGAHDAHLRAVNGYTGRQVLCTDCHAVPTSVLHANGATDYSWSNLSKNIGTTGSVSTRGTLTPTYSAGTCSTNYCHGGVLNGGTDTTPTWNDTTYLTAYAKNATNCGKCHGAPPTSGATLGFNHSGYTIASACGGCHGHEGNGPKHMDGILQAAGGSCDSCHSYDTVGGVWGSGAHLDGATAEGWGAHARHIDHLKALAGVTLNAGTDAFGSANFNAVCGVCHTQDPANHTMDNSSQRMINFNADLLTYKFGSSAPAYTGVSGTPSSTTPKVCSNISCHFGATPRWQ
ncbi:MAG: hypothetical protein CXR31_13850 [Geobacter sp.]|nr:MAG: hypothetical protein CXR31_13850 [Geobacter sp.]